jgi:hypothetical protein
MNPFSSSRPSLRSFWRNYGVAGFGGLAFGIGVFAAIHLASVIAWAGFGVLLLLLGRLPVKARRDKGERRASRMFARVKPMSILQGVVGLGLVITGLGNFGLIGGWGDAGSKFGFVVGTVITSTGLGFCAAAVTATRRVRSDSSENGSGSSPP